ncbi:hypothetical protein [Kitasatospora sp. NPDC050543]|uniref:hypothetical protein n=1 Tax=Kitasatospora sp. NPDC050543 TaxID=3364054 RepID=UPI00379203BA
MNLQLILQAEAEDIEREFLDHDPVAFTRRLAERIASSDERQAAARSSGRSERAPATARRQAPAPQSRRPRVDPLSTTNRAELRRDLETLCADVVNTTPPEQLAQFVEDCDEAGARTFGCLLYTLGRPSDAAFWWGVAAGAEDDLAVHCLAVHYAAAGNEDQADLWRARALDTGEVNPAELPEAGAVAEEPVAVAENLVEELDDDLASALKEWVSPPPRMPSGPAPGATTGRTVPRGKSPRRRVAAEPSPVRMDPADSQPAPIPAHIRR